MTIDKVLWLLAAISFGIGALVGLAANPGVLTRIGWMLLAFMFIALTFVV